MKNLFKRIWLFYLSIFNFTRWYAMTTRDNRRFLVLAKAHINLMKEWDTLSLSSYLNSSSIMWEIALTRSRGYNRQSKAILNQMNAINARRRFNS